MPTCPYYSDETITLYHGLAEDVLPMLPDASIQLICIDPPYMNVKAESWDRQWATREAYLSWLRNLAKEWQRILTPNGSLYCFASPQMAAHVEVMLEEMFHIIQRITWRKPPFSTKAEMFDKESCRMFFPASEAILFCEQAYADKDAMGESGYMAKCHDLHCQVYERVFGQYLTSELQRASATGREIAALFPSVTGRLTGCVSNWLLGYNQPTRDQYHAIRDYLNRCNGSTDYLRREYEDLRREYEDLRRPFTVSANVPYTDVFDFKTVPAHQMKHPCQKPLALIRHLITVSSRPNDTVLDCFMGSGTTMEAAKECGRKAIGIEMDKRWYRHAISRVSQGIMPFI